jgi:hypothetical protein
LLLWLFALSLTVSRPYIQDPAHQILVDNPQVQDYDPCWRSPAGFCCMTLAGGALLGFSVRPLLAEPCWISVGGQLRVQVRVLMSLVGAAWLDFGG